MHTKLRIVVAAGAALLAISLTWLLVSCNRKTGTHDGLGPITATPSVESNVSPSVEPSVSPSSPSAQPGGETGGVVVEPAPKDCTTYDPATLSVASAGASGWYLRYGTKNMAVLDTKTDAEDAMKVVRGYTQACYVGRGNQRPVRDDFIVRYWEVPSGLPLGAAPSHFDCESYEPSQLSIGSAGDAWWLLRNGEQLLKFDTAGDAMRIMLHAKDFHKVCFIGRGNLRPVPSHYVLAYWMQ